MNGCFSFPSFRWHWHLAISIQPRWGNKTVHGQFLMEPFRQWTPETTADPVWTLHCVGNIVTETLLPDLSILTQESIYTSPQTSFLLPPLTQKVPRLCVAVGVGVCQEGCPQERPPSQHDVCIQLDWLQRSGVFRESSRLGELVKRNRCL